MSSVRLRPSSERMVVDWLTRQLPEATIATDLEVGWEDTLLPLVQPGRAGGRPTNSLLDQARIDFDCYVAQTEGRAAAELLARTVEAVLPAMKGVTGLDDGGGVVTDVGFEAGPHWRPSAHPKVIDYGLVALLTIRWSAPPRGPRTASP